MILSAQMIICVNILSLLEYIFTTAKQGNRPPRGGAAPPLHGQLHPDIPQCGPSPQLAEPIFGFEKKKRLNTQKRKEIRKRLDQFGGVEDIF